MVDGNDLANHLNSFSISSEEERLTNQLDKTHIASTTTNSIFSLPPHLQQQQTQHATTASTFSAFSPQQDTAVNNANNRNTNNGNHWDGNNNAVEWNDNTTWTDNTSTQPQEGEGWGDGPPSYTSISQGTYFGFNSIMEVPKIASMSNPNESSSAASSQAFSRFKGAPVTFASAAAEHQQNK